MSGAKKSSVKLIHVDEKEEVKLEEAKKADKVKITRVRQSEIPTLALEEAIKVPTSIWEDCGGKSTPSFQVAGAIDLSPTSSNWRVLSGAAFAYNLTTGAYNSKEIGLSDIGKKIVAPTADDEDRVALIQAVMTPSILNKFYKFYDGGKLPKDVIVKNKLIEMGVAKEKVDEVYEIVLKNGYYTGVIQNVKGGDFICLSSPKSNENGKKNNEDLVMDSNNGDNNVDEKDYEVPVEVLERMNIKKDSPKTESASASIPLTKPKVFITHGKNRAMVEQLKELLTFGQFEPIVSVERESTAIPVPDKVFNDMSECQAGIIHIAGEQLFLDQEGKEHRKINENVLIEIGAAIAFYRKKVILLCQKGVTLPSNLQGLYRCEYEGEQLDYAGAMKLLRTFNEFKIS